MGGQGAELGLGTAAALGGIGATVLGQPEIGIPLLLGGIGMDTGTGFGGTKGGLMGATAGGIAGLGAEGLGAGAMGIPQLAGMTGMSTADAAMPSTAQGLASGFVGSDVPAAANPAEERAFQSAAANVAKTLPVTPAAETAMNPATKAALLRLGAAGLQSASPAIAQATQPQPPMQTPPLPQRPAAPATSAPTAAVASTSEPNPMAALAEYSNFLKNPMGMAA